MGRPRTHGSTPEYKTWYRMQHRCQYASSYIKKGIKVCDRWLYGEEDLSGLECFIVDMGPKPSSKHSIDRFPDNNGDYCPDNCRWATRKEQAWSLIGVPKTPEIRAAIGAANKGKRTGIPHSPETRAKIAKANRARAWKQVGVSMSEETRAKMSKTRTGKKFSEETKRRMSLARKRWWNGQEAT